MSLEEDVISTISACIPCISAKGATEVRHYLEHGEPEMAFEGCLLELIDADRLPAGVAFSELAALAKALGLDEDSVFDQEIWTKLNRWGKQFFDDR